MTKKENNDLRIYLVAEATTNTPTGYHATFHRGADVKPFSIDDISFEDFACPILSEDILVVKKGSPEAGVTNMVCSYLTGENYYTDVAFLAFDQKTRLLTLPTFGQLKTILDLTCIKIDPSAQGNISFTDSDEDSQDSLPDISLRKIAAGRLDLFADLGVPLFQEPTF